MANTSTPSPLDPATSFKGHAQPPVNERLAQAKVFLADEDINRSLRFTEHLAEIEEYLKNVEEKKLDCDARLLKDVQVMASVQRHWTDNMDAPIKDRDENDNLNLPNFSTRLVDADTNRRLDEQREAEGHITQMRADHPPFTVNRSADHAEFLRELKKDAEGDQEDLHERENLLFLESAAYTWALDQPALIPYWMHWEKGLPNEGIKLTDPVPWYRDTSRYPTVHAYKESIIRPPVDNLPSYLQTLEKSINQKLEVKSDDLSRKLELANLLYALEPESLHDLHSNLKHLEAEISELNSLDVLTRRDTRELEDLWHKFESEFDKWLREIPDEGVQIKILDPRITQINVPGVFYVPIQPSPLAAASLEYSEETINHLLSLTNRSLAEMTELKRLLVPFRPTNIRALDRLLEHETSLTLKAANFTDLPTVLSPRAAKLLQERNTKLDNWMQSLISAKMASSQSQILLQFQLPGQDENTSDPDILNCSWPSPHFTDYPGDVSYIPPKVKRLESEINDIIFEVTSGVSDNSKHEAKLRHLLQNVMYPRLRDLVAQNLTTGDLNVHHLVQNWELCLLSGVDIRMPPRPDFEEDPNILYYRGHMERSWIPRQVPQNPQRPHFEAWAKEIQHAKQDFPLTSGWMKRRDDAYRGRLYELLADLQYPRLKRLDIEWTALQQKTNLTKWEREAVIDMHDQWKSLFLAWQNNFGNDAKLIIKAVDPQEISTCGLGDPRVVYFRGPLLNTSSESDLTLERPVQAHPLPLIEQMVQHKTQSALDSLDTNPDHSLPQDTKDFIDQIITKYWRPARDYSQAFKFGADWQFRDQWSQEYKQRYALFIEECTAFGFGLERTRNGNFIAHDWTRDRSKEWKLPGIPRLESIIDYASLLDELWKTPTAFREQILDLECEINDGLRAYEPPSLDAGDYNRLVQILYQFLPKEIRHSFEALEEPTNTPRRRLQHELMILDHLQMLADSANIAWITIGYLDPAVLRGDWPPEHDSTALLYYFHPSDVLPDASEPVPSLFTINHSDPLPVGFRRMEHDMNCLLEKRRAGELDFDGHDKLRTLFYGVMDPTLRDLEAHLRDDDARWRAGRLTPELMGDYVEKSAYFYRLFDHWMDSFGNEDIRLHRVDPQDRSPNSLVLQIQNPWDVPAKFRSSELPVPILNIQNALNEYIIAQPDGSDNLEERLLKDLFNKYGHLWEQRLMATERRHQKLGAHEELDADDLLRIDNSVQYKVGASVVSLKRHIKSEREPMRLRMIEQRRGVIDWLLTTQETDYFPEDAASSAVDFDRLNIVDIAEYITAPWLDKAKSELKRLVERVKDGTFSTSDQKRVQQLLDARPPLETENKFTQILDMASNGATLLEGQEQGLIISYLQYGWHCVLESHPEYRTLLFSPDFGASSKNDSSQPTQQAIPNAGCDNTQIEAELNSMLDSFQKGELPLKLVAEFDSILKLITRGRLAGLNRRGKILDKKRHLSAANLLNLDEGMVLYQYSIEEAEMFHKWKMNLRPGVIVLDDLYFGPEAVQKVVQRYQHWKNRGGAAPAVSEGPDGGYQQKLQRIYPTLKKFALSDSAQNGEELWLDRIPPALKRLQNSMCKLCKRLDHQKPEDVSIGERLLLRILQRSFVQAWVTWYEEISRNSQAVHSRPKSSRAVDFSGKAEKRGVQRAAVELALNLLATNQEQHRPHDRFRRVKLPRKYKTPPEEVPLCLPLKPWQRPVEVDTIKYTKILRKYRQLKDNDYDIARIESMNEMSGTIWAPKNFTGPYTLSSNEALREEYKKRQYSLLRIQGSLFTAERNAPRPLIERLILLIDDSLTCVTKGNGVHPDVDEESPLTPKEIQTLVELADPSWSENSIKYAESIPAIEANQPWSMARLAEFERNLGLILLEIPFWRPADTGDAHDSLEQVPYNSHRPSVGEDGKPHGWYVTGDPATQSVDVTESIAENHQFLLHYLNDRLIQDAANSGERIPHPWNDDEAVAYLTVMRNANRIFYDASHNLIARIPPSGHPENKYVVSREDAEQSRHVHFNAQTKQYEVQYDARGGVGPPIIQPNKFEFLEQAALKLGRDLGFKLQELANDPSGVQQKLDLHLEFTNRTQAYMNGLSATCGIKTKFTGIYSSRAAEPTAVKDISLRKIAHDLNIIAPDLLKEAGIIATKGSDDWLVDLTENKAGTAIQMQILEEANNCWESRFPENEHVWEFATFRLNTTEAPSNGRNIRIPQTQFFDLRRWPLADQSSESQERITKNTLQIQEKPSPARPVSPKSRAELISERKKKWKEEGRHTGRGQPPMFLLGETPYQQAWNSHEIEKDLADVDEFYPKPDPPNWFQRNILPRIRKLPFLGVDQSTVASAIISSDDEENYGYHDDDDDGDFSLPKIPLGWVPDSVSEIQKRYDVSDRLLKDHAKRQVEELYFSPLEVATRDYYKEQQNILELKEEAVKAIESYCGLEWKYIKDSERRRARAALDIDPVTEIIRAKPIPVPTSAPKRTKLASPTSKSAKTSTTLP